MCKALLAGGAFVILLPLVAGCGSKGITVRGHVTLNGEAVEQGHIALYPEDGHGTTVAAPISHGEYQVDNVSPGKKRIQVMLTEAVQAPASNAGRSRTDANARRLEGLKDRTQPHSGRPRGDANLTGNNRVVEITGSMDDLNIELKRGGKTR